MNYLLDTNHWSYIQQRQPVVIARLKSLARSDKLLMSVVTQGELLAGIERRPPGRRLSELERLYKQEVRRAARILPIDSDVAQHFATVYARLHAVGRTIETNDMWIAATALAHDLTVVSNDAHFRWVDGLRVEDWTQAG